MNKKESKELKGKILEYAASELVTKRELCSHFGITPQTLNKWRREDREFNRGINEARSIALAPIHETALQALKKYVGGYTETLTKEKYSVDEKGNRRLVSVIVERREAAPPVKALLAVLEDTFNCDIFSE